MRNRLLRLVAYVAVLAAAIAVVYSVGRPNNTPQAMTSAHSHGAARPESAATPVVLSVSDARRIGVTYATATLGTFGKEVRTVGQIVFDETRMQTVAVKVDGFVEKLDVNTTGQPVAAGAALLSIYSPMLVTAQEELLLAKRLRDDLAKADGDATARADDLLRSARRRLAYWDVRDEDVAAIEQGGQARRTIALRSPASGYVVEKNVFVGQKVMAGDVLYKIADLRTVWVEGEVFEQDAASVRVGQTVHADFQALPGESRTGRISFIYPTLNPDTRTLRVRVVLPNPRFVLKPGMYATLRIKGTERAGVLTVPRSAVLSTGERNMVFVRDAMGRLVSREVSLGAANDDRVEIVQGLNVGETVVSSATFLVDAESNLRTALGGMGDMPGMDMTTPPKPLKKE